MHKAILFEKVETKNAEQQNPSVKCTACNNYCIISPGKSGICGVRKNVDGTLYLMVYGKAAAAHVDPVEKKPLYHFLPGKPIFSIGTIGCNFGCEFCQNWDMSQASKGLKDTPLEFSKRLDDWGYALSPKEIIDACKKQAIPAVAFTYNEPVIFFEYAYDTMKLAKKAGIKTVFVSNGYESEEALKKLSGLLDAINIDLKSFRDAFYRKLCHARLEPVLKTIMRCHELGIWVELTTLFIPGENDSEQEMHDIVDFIASVSPDIPWHVSAFHPEYKMLDRKNTPHETLMRAYAIGKKKLNYVYVGNVSDPKRSATYCPSCRKELIDRTRYIGRIVGMKQGACASCGAWIAGIWS
jgi:pyruvate formate lyase activating enzyme